MTKKLRLKKSNSLKNDKLTDKLYYEKLWSKDSDCYRLLLKKLDNFELEIKLCSVQLKKYLVSIIKIGPNFNFYPILWYNNIASKLQRELRTQQEKRGMDKQSQWEAVWRHRSPSHSICTAIIEIIIMYEFIQSTGWLTNQHPKTYLPLYVRLPRR